MRFSLAVSSLVSTLLLLITSGSTRCDAFAPRSSTVLAKSGRRASTFCSKHRSTTSLRMGLDLVTYLRTEWVSAALCTNQTPRAADICLQLGCEDGRAVTFVPRTIRQIITSSAEANGELPVGVKRQLKQQQERRQAATLKYVNQRADDLKETADDSVDVVVSLQAAVRMMENGLDWKRSVREAARVLKPGGRLLFVEQSMLDGESYLEYVDTLTSLSDDPVDAKDETTEEEAFPIFEVGFDDVDLVLVPHVAGVAIKSEFAGLTPEERALRVKSEEQARIADLSITAYERGLKKRKRKKKGVKEEDTTNST